eukprot:4109953-Amphidinium_carterae.1
MIQCKIVAWNFRLGHSTSGLDTALYPPLIFWYKRATWRPTLKTFEPNGSSTHYYKNVPTMLLTGGVL